MKSNFPKAIITDSLLNEKYFSNQKNKIGHIETIRGGRMFSLLYHGGYQAPDYYNPVFRKFWDEIKARKLKTDPKDDVFRFAVLMDE